MGQAQLEAGERPDILGEDGEVGLVDDRRARIPMGRYGTEAEVSSLIGWLASDQGGYVTGQNWRIDGGLTRAV